MDTTQYLKDLAAKWTSKWPTHADRIGRGLEVAEANKVAPRGLNTFRVAGTDAGVEYLVEVNCGFPRCDCPDFGFGYRCKHIWAVALMERLSAAIEAQVTKAPRVRTPAKPRRNDLSERCAQHHKTNHESAEALRPLAQVIPFRK